MKNPSINYLKIGQAAKALGVSIDTLRRWEKAGKITPIRTPGGTRLYSLSALKKVNPGSVKTFQTSSLSTEELLKHTESDNQILNYAEISDYTEEIPSRSEKKKASIVSRFLIGSAILSTITILLVSWITASYLSSPKETQQFFKSNIASGILSPFHLLAEEAVMVISPGKAKELGFNQPDEPPPLILTQKLNSSSAVLAVTSLLPFLEVNSDTQINGSLFVRDSINGLSMEATPSAGTMAFTAGANTLTVTKSAKLDQDVSTTSSPTFASPTVSSLTLSATSNQLASGGFQFTLPSATTTLVGTDTTQTLTNKSMSGSSNTFTNIPNSALTNSKVTVTAGTNLTGGGDVSLGSSITIALKDSPSVTTLTAAGIVSLADGTAAAPALTFTSDTDTGLYRIGTNKIGLITAGTATSGITIDASGNVGIGTISPGTALEVTGQVKITGGTPGANKVLTSDASGLASWTSMGSVGVASISNSDGTLTISPTLGDAVASLNLGNANSWTATQTFSNSTYSALFTGGNVGVGTTSPNYKLDVTGQVNGSTGLCINGDCKTTWSGSAGYTASNGITLSSTDFQLGGQLSRATGIDINSQNFGFLGGNVGIGKSNPSYQLETTGNVGIGSSLTVTSVGTFGGLSVSGLSSLGNVNASTLTATGQFLASNGSASLPSYSFSNLPNAGLWTNGDGLLLTTGSSNTSGITVTGAGYVGIGITNPTNSLTIAGNRTISASGGTLVLDASNLNVNVGTSGTGREFAVFGNMAVTNYFRLGTTNQFKVYSETLSQEVLRMNTSGNMGIGNSNPGSMLSVSGNGTIGFGSASSITGPTNGLAVSGNVGIGTTSPNYKLDVAGQVNGSTGLCINGDCKTTWSGSAGYTASNGITLSSTDFQLGGQLSRATGIDINSQNFGFLGGNVGIGTTAPAQKLDVNGNIAIAGADNWIGTAANGEEVMFTSGTGYLNLGARSIMGFYGDSNNSNNTATSPLFEFHSGDAIGTGLAKMVMLTNGNVGIGTTSPNYKLGVAGQVNGSTGLCIAGDCKTTWTGVGGYTASNGITLSSVDFQLGGQLTKTTSIDINSQNFGFTNGNVGIGTATPGSTLHVNGNAMIGYGATATPASLANGLAVSGNVGIGTTSPNTALDVSGGITGTPTTNATALTLTGTNVSTTNLAYFNAKNTSGTIFNLAYGASATLTGDLIGQAIDLNNGKLDNSNNSVTGLKVILPTVTNTNAAGTVNIRGFQFGFGNNPAGILQDGAGATVYSGVDIGLPNLAQSQGTLTANGVLITTPTSITTGGTANGINISPTHVGAVGTLNGINIGAIGGSHSQGAETETAIAVGAGWDNVLTVNSNTIINGAGVTQVVGGGTGIDTYNTGDILYASGLTTLTNLGIGTSGQVLTTTAGVPIWANVNGSSCVNCLINNPTSTQIISPIGQATTGLSVRQTSTDNPTGNIFEVTDHFGTNPPYFYVDKNGNVSTGAIANTTLTLTPTSDTTALTLNGNKVTTAPLAYFNAHNTQGTIFNMAYGSSQSLTGSLTGQAIDFTNLGIGATNQSVTGAAITLPAVTNTNATGTETYTGLQVSSAGGLNQNAAGATQFNGVAITVPALTQTSGTITGNGILVNTSSLTGGGTVNGINIAASGVGAITGVLNGINISNIIGTDGREVAFNVGTGWDYAAIFAGGNVGIGFTSPAASLDVSGLSSPAAGADGRLTRIAGTINEAGSGTHALLSGLEITAPTITAGAATVTTAATLYVSGATTAVGATNWALDVAGGNSNFGGNIFEADEQFIRTGNDSDMMLGYKPSASNEIKMLVGKGGTFTPFVFGPFVGYDQNFGHGLTTDPTFFIHSALNPAISNNEWGSFTHDQNGFVITTGANIGVGTTPATIDNYIAFAPRGIEQMRIAGDGNVGIGTTAPTQKLTLAGGNFLQTAGTPTVKATINDLTKLYKSRGVYVSGNYAYVVNDHTDPDFANFANFAVVDISNPASPVVAGTINDDTYLHGARGIFVSGKYAYVTNNDNTAPTKAQFTIVDISNPTSPSVVGSLTNATDLLRAYGIFVSGKYAYVAAGGATSSFNVINVSNPTSPTLVTSLHHANFYYANGMYVQGKYAYMIGETGGLTVIDISNPASPSIPVPGNITSATALPYASSITVSGRYAYIGNQGNSAGNSNFTVVDLKDPANPAVVGTLEDGTHLGSPQQISVAGKYAYVVNNDSFPGQTADFVVIDISTPTDPIEVGTINSDTSMSNASGISVSGKYAYVVNPVIAGTNSNFTVIDISGVDVPAANIGNLAVGTLNVWDNMKIANSLSIGTGLNVGQGGIYSAGPVTITGNSADSALATLDVRNSAYTSLFYVRNDGNVGIGTTGPGASLSVAGNGTIGWGGATSIAGPTNGLAISGNVGIGTTSPAYKLDVAGQVNGSTGLCINGDCKSSWTGSGNYTASNGITLSSTDFQLGGSLTRATGIDISSQNFGFLGGNVGIGTTNPSQLFQINNSVSNPFVVTSGGNVGIGTTTPFGGVHIRKSGQALNLQTASTADTFDIQFYNADDTSGNYKWDLSYRGSNSNNNLQLFRDSVGGISTSVMTWESGSGNVGIGTTNPLAIFAVGTGATSNFRVTSAGIVNTVNGTASAPSYSFTNSTGTGLWSPSANALSLTTNGLGTSGITITAGGNVGIGTTAPVAKLDVLASYTNPITGSTGQSTETQLSATNASNNTNTVVSSANAIILSTNTQNWTGAFPGNGVLDNWARTDIQNGATGTITSSHNYYAAGIVIPSGFTVTNHADFAAMDAGNYGGTLINQYGVYVDNLTTATTNNFAVYTAGTTKSYFGGNVGIGFTSPNALLHIGGADQTTAAYGIQMGSDITLYRSAANTLKTDNNLVIGGSFTPSGQILASDGTATLPSYSFTSDPDSGLWRVGTNLLALTTAGTPAAGQAIRGLSVNANGNVGIGTTSPSAVLEAYGTNAGIKATDSSDGSNISIASSDVGYLNSSTSLYISSATNGYIQLVSAGTISLSTANNNAITLSPNGTGSVQLTSGTTTGTGTSAGLSLATNSLQSGTAMDITSTSTAGTASQSDILLNLSRSGANSNTAHTAYGIYSSVTNTNGTSGTNIAGYFSASGATTANYGLLVASGNVGIGTTGPAYKLDVNLGNVNSNTNIGYNVYGNATSNVGYAGYNLQLDNSTANTSGYLRLARTSSTVFLGMELASQSRDGIRFLTNATTPVEAMRIDASGNVGIANAAPTGLFQVGNSGTPPLYIASSTGNVGIGTTGPAQKLDVNGNIGITGADNWIGTAQNGEEMMFNSGTGYLSLGARSVMAFYGDSNNISNPATSPLFEFHSGDAIGSGLAKMVMLTNGNVGIGTTNPVSTLQVMGNVGIGATTSSNKLDVWGNARVTGNLTVDGTLNTGSISAPNFLAGNGSATAPAYSFTNLPNAGLWTNGDGLLLTAGGTNTKGITVTSAGYVGIGTTNPTAPLHIQADTSNYFMKFKNNDGSDNNNYWSSSSLRVASQIYFYGSQTILSSNGSNITLAPGGTGDLLVTTDADTDLNVGSGQLFVQGSNGNVGIGFTSPNALLHIGGADQTTAAYGIQMGSDITLYRSAANTLKTDNNLVIGGALNVANGSASAPAYSFTNLPNAGLWTNGDGLLLTAGGTNTKGITVTGAGYVGIGTTAPVSRLNVQAAATTYYTGTGFDTLTIGKRPDAAASRISINYDSTHAIFLEVNNLGALNFYNQVSGNIFTMLNGGNIGIANGSPTGLFQVGNSVTPPLFVTSSTGNVGIGTTGPSQLFQINNSVSNPFVVTSGGNVGVGFTSPNNLFTVGATNQFQVNSSGYALLPNGLVGSPSLTFTNDPDTGIWTSGANTLNFSIGSAEALRIDSNSNVVLGTATNSLNATQKLTVYSANTNFGDYSQVLISSNDAMAADKGGYIAFGGIYTGSPSLTNVADFAGIAGRKENAITTNTAGYLSLGTRPANGNITERLRITSTGNVGIGFTSPNALLHIGGADQTTAAYGIQMGSDITLYRSAANTLKTDNNLVVGGTLTTAGLTNTGQFLAADGTAALPSYSFTSDPDSGLWRVGTNLLALTAGGTPAAGNTINGLSVNASGNVGIGTTSPLYKLQISAAANETALYINERNNWQVNSNGLSGTVHASTFSIQDGGAADTTNKLYSNGSNIMELKGYSGVRLVSDEATANILLLPGKNVGIGFTSPNALLHIGGANQTTAPYGIQMGSDITLYRSAANTLKTDNNLVVGGTLTTAGLTNTGQFLAADGTAALPSYSFTSDPDSGLWRVGTNLLALTAGGTPAAGNTINGLSVNASGNVGIGTTSPLYKLQISAAANETALYINERNNWQVNSNGLSGTVHASTFSIQDGGAADTTNKLYSNGSNIMELKGYSGVRLVSDEATANILLLPGKNVGIGFTSPNALLHIGGANQTTAPYGIQMGSDITLYRSAVNTLKTTNNLVVGGDVTIGPSATDWGGISNTNNNILGADATGVAGAGQSITWSMNAGGFAQAIYNANTATNANGLLVKIAGTAAGNRIFELDTGAAQGTAGTSVMTVLGNGNVGIGTTTPAAKLQIGSGQIFAPDGTQAAPSYSFSSDTGTGMYRGASGDMYFTTNNALSFLIRDTDVIMGSGVAFDMNNGTLYGDDDVSGNLKLSATQSVTKTNSYISFAVAGEAMRIDSANNVGIGTTSPAAKFEVSSGTAAPWSRLNPGDSTFTVSSSKNFKENFNLVSGTNILDKISSVPVYTFDFINGSKNVMGLLAEDFATVFGKGDGSSINYQEVAMANWLGIQQLNQKAQNLQTENYPSHQTLEPGDVVVTDETDNAYVTRSTTAYQQTAIGIVSTKQDTDYSIALSGKVPVKVSVENGPVTKGDFLTSSSFPGVAMKATRPGQVIGKALEPFDGSDLTNNSKIMVFVNISYADPGNFLASLSLDDSGNLIMPNIKVDKLLVTSEVKVDGKLLAKDGTTDLVEKESTNSAQIANLTSQVASASAQTHDLADQISSASAELVRVRSDVDSLKLTPPDILLATGSATLANIKVESEATVSGMLTAYAAAIQDNFKVLGSTTLGNTLIAGDLTVDGTMSINGSSINSITTLYIQNSPLAENIDLFNGKVTIDKNGLLIAQKISTPEIITNKLTISNTPIASGSATLGTSIGTGTLPANASAVTIQTTEASESAKVFITPTTTTDKVLSVTNVVNGKSFDVSVLTPPPTDIKFNWWIVQTE